MKKVKIKAYYCLLLSVVMAYSPLAFSETVLTSKKWQTNCEKDVFLGNSQCFIINHESSLNSGRSLMIQKGAADEFELIILEKGTLGLSPTTTIDVNIKVDKEEAITAKGVVSSRNQDYTQLAISVENFDLLLKQMKKGNFIYTKVPLQGTNVMDKFSLSGFTKNINKALELEKRADSTSTEVKGPNDLLAESIKLEVERYLSIGKEMERVRNDNKIGVCMTQMRKHHSALRKLEQKASVLSYEYLMLKTSVTEAIFCTSCSDSALEGCDLSKESLKMYEARS